MEVARVRGASPGRDAVATWSIIIHRRRDLNGISKRDQ
jgi:hypothetical protein